MLRFAKIGFTKLRPSRAANLPTHRREFAVVPATASGTDFEGSSFNYRWVFLVASLFLGSHRSENEQCTSCKPQQYSLIVVGGGTAGCTVAYLSAKWLLDNGIGGKVLLIDKGVDFFDPAKGPNPRMSAWFENWGSYGEAHAAMREDGTAYPVTGSEHRGVGGCGTHDTRITFQPTPTTLMRFANMMDWSLERTRTYFQAALDLIPVVPAIAPEQPERFYQEVLQALPHDMRVAGDNHGTEIKPNSLAVSSLAAYPNELRWTSAYLLHDSVRPSNLEVMTGAAVDKVVLEGDAKSAGGLAAKGVEVLVGDGADQKRVFVCLDAQGEVALTGGAFGATAVLQRSGVGPKQVLEAAGVRTVLVDNPEVGHGVDHAEIAVLYEWLDKWNEPGTGEPPRGGLMGWPMVAFLPFPSNHRTLFPSTQEVPSTFMMGHFGAGYAEPYTDFPTVVCTPNCIRPDMATGFRAAITSTSPAHSMRMVHAEQDADWAAIAKGVLSTVSLMEGLREKGMVGGRLEPDFDPADLTRLVLWVRDNHFTAFHWACTCQAGVQGRVADERFRVRSTAHTGGQRDVVKTEDQARGQGRYDGVVRNLLVGSAAALPELPDANPHLSITAFSVALADELVRTQAQRRAVQYRPPSELRRALTEVRGAAARGSAAAVPALSWRAAGQEYPDLSRVASEHYSAWCLAHQAEDDKDT